MMKCVTNSPLLVSPVQNDLYNLDKHGNSLTPHMMALMARKFVMSFHKGTDIMHNDLR